MALKIIRERIWTKEEKEAMNACNSALQANGQRLRHKYGVTREPKLTPWIDWGGYGDTRKCEDSAIVEVELLAGRKMISPARHFRWLTKGTNPFDIIRYRVVKSPNAKLTPWFDENTPPVRIGIYQVKAFEGDDGVRYAYWNGKLWSYWSSRIDTLITIHMCDILMGRTHDALPWRGLSRRSA